MIETDNYVASRRRSCSPAGTPSGRWPGSAGGWSGGRAALAERFRADVGRALAAPDATGGEPAGPTRLVLRMPGGGRVVYQWKDGALERGEGATGRETFRRVPVAASGLAVTFLRGKGDRPLVTLRLTEELPPGPPQTADISAALGGDAR